MQVITIKYMCIQAPQVSKEGNTKCISWFSGPTHLLFTAGIGFQTVCVVKVVSLVSTKGKSVVRHRFLHTFVTSRYELTSTSILDSQLLNSICKYLLEATCSFCFRIAQARSRQRVQKLMVVFTIKCDSFTTGQLQELFPVILERNNAPLPERARNIAI